MDTEGNGGTGSEERGIRVGSVYVLPVRHVMRTMSTSLKDVEFAEREEFHRSVTSVLRVRMRHLLDVQPLACSNDIMKVYRDKYPFDTDDDTVRNIIKRLQQKNEKSKRKLDAAISNDYDRDDSRNDLLVIDEDMGFEDDNLLEPFDDENGDFEIDDEDDDDDMLEADDDIPLDNRAEVLEELLDEARQQVELVEDQGQDVVQTKDINDDIDADKVVDNDDDKDDDKDGENDISNEGDNDIDNNGDEYENVEEEMKDNVEDRNIPDESDEEEEEVVEVVEVEEVVEVVVEEEAAHIIDDAPPDIPEDDGEEEEDEDDEDDDDDDDDSVEVPAIANIHIHEVVQHPVFNHAHADLIAMFNNEILKLVENEINNEVSTDDELSEISDEDDEDDFDEGDKSKKPEDQPDKKNNEDLAKGNDSAEKASA